MENKNLKPPEYYREKIEKIERQLSGLAHKADRMEMELKRETERRRKHRLIVWGSHLEYLLREMCQATTEQMEGLTDARQREILDSVFSDSGIAQLFRAEIHAAIQRQDSPERQ